MAGKKSSLPANASKREKFVYYANIRAGAAVKAIENLGTLAGNPSAYEFTKADAEKLEAHINEAVKKMSAAFAKPGSGKAAAAKIIE